jgi:hypothetical protein
MLLKVQMHSYDKRCFGNDVQESDVHLLRGNEEKYIKKKVNKESQFLD